MVSEMIGFYKIGFIRERKKKNIAHEGMSHPKTQRPLCDMYFFGGHLHLKTVSVLVLSSNNLLQK